MPKKNILVPVDDANVSVSGGTKAHDIVGRFDPDTPIDIAFANQEARLQARYDALGGKLLGAVVAREYGAAWTCERGYLRYDPAVPDTQVSEVYGAIFTRWSELGGLSSYLRHPTSPEVGIDGGRATTFAGGAIYWWRDLGAIDLKGVSVAYTGVLCIDETDPELTNRDDPYVILSHLAPTTSGTVSTKVYGPTDDGQAWSDVIEIYNGPPWGIALSATVMENDLGDPNAYRSKVEEVVAKAHSEGMSAMKAIPWIGDTLADLAGPYLEKLLPLWTQTINDALGTGDERVGEHTIRLTPRQMVELAARTPAREQAGISFKIETPHLAGEGGTYVVYFGIVPT